MGNDIARNSSFVKGHICIILKIRHCIKETEIIIPQCRIFNQWCFVVSKAAALIRTFYNVTDWTFMLYVHAVSFNSTFIWDYIGKSLMYFDVIKIHIKLSRQTRSNYTKIIHQRIMRTGISLSSWLMLDATDIHVSTYFHTTLHSMSFA